MKANKKKVPGTVVAVVGVVAAVIAAVALFLGMKSLNSFNAQGYVSGILDQNFKGDVSQISEIVDGQSEKELLKQYEDGVKAFLENRLMYGVELDEETEQKYIALCKEIFKSMKYEVKEAEKVDDDKYQVPVVYQASDVFEKLDVLVEEEFARIYEKADQGEYSDENGEINQQMQQEFLENVYELLKQAHENAKYGEKETMVIVVEKNKDGLYTLGTQLNEFILKITREDVKED